MIVVCSTLNDFSLIKTFYMSDSLLL